VRGGWGNPLWRPLIFYLAIRGTTGPVCGFCPSNHSNDDNCSQVGSVAPRLCIARLTNLVQRAPVLPKLVDLVDLVDQFLKLHEEDSAVRIVPISTMCKEGRRSDPLHPPGPLRPPVISECAVDQRYLAERGCMRERFGVRIRGVRRRPECMLISARLRAAITAKKHCRSERRSVYPWGRCADKTQCVWLMEKGDAL
jgi:hypothetical protein